MMTKINQHNKKILQKIINEEEASTKTCSCPRNVECPMDNNCLDKNILYTAEISSNLRNYGTKEYKPRGKKDWEITKKPSTTRYTKEIQSFPKKYGT